MIELYVDEIFPSNIGGITKDGRCFLYNMGLLKKNNLVDPDYPELFIAGKYVCFKGEDSGIRFQFFWNYKDHFSTLSGLSNLIQPLELRERLKELCMNALLYQSDFDEIILVKGLPPTDNNN